MFGIAASKLRSNLLVGTFPEGLKIAGNGHRTSCGICEFDAQRKSAIDEAGRIRPAKCFLNTQGNTCPLVIPFHAPLGAGWDCDLCWCLTVKVPIQWPDQERGQSLTKGQVC